MHPPPPHSDGQNNQPYDCRHSRKEEDEDEEEDEEEEEEEVRFS